MKIAIVGDYNPESDPHQATDRVVRHIGEGIWVPTENVTVNALSDFDALWIAPSSPYKSLDGALTTIRYGREHKIPMVGCCAGCQHMVLEFAQNVLRIDNAEHAEYERPGGAYVLTRLTCSLAGQRLEIELKPQSLAARAYGRERIVEKYYCNFGVNPEYQQSLENAGLRITGTDETREARVIELDGHPFFLGTLFVPDATADQPHPIAAALRSLLLQQKVAGEQRVNA